MKKESLSLICPYCFSDLVLFSSAYRCNSCMREYPLKEGVVCFLDSDDKFYEGTYTATINVTFRSERSLNAILYFYFYREPYLKAIRKHVKSSGIILDIGCGGGTRYLAQKGEVVGLDLSFGSLKKVTGFYKMAVQANALKLPFPDKTFDLITGSYNFEHFLPDEKQVLLGQMNRVLKPGGKIILLFDCDNNNPLFRWFKKDRELYQKCFIEHDHHYGLQLPSINLGLIEKAGFSIIEYKALNKTPLQYLPVYGWMTPYGTKSKLVSFVSNLASFVGKKKVLWVPYYALINWFDAIIERLLPLDYARVLLVIAQK